MPKISVIVPTYNTAKYLPRCLDSILAQTFQDFEIIIISDGPEEDHKVADEYAAKDSRITVLKDIKKGLGGARNAGLKIAKGEYISFVDSDDWIEPETFKEAVKVFDKNIDWVIFSANVKYDKGMPKDIELEKYYEDLKYSGEHGMSTEMFLNTNVSAWNKLYRKEIIDLYNISFPEKMACEDFPFYFHYGLAANNAYFLNKKFYNYFQRNSSFMHKCVKNNYEGAKAHLMGCKFLYDELNRNNLYKENYYTFSEIFSKWITIGLSHCARKYRKKYLDLAYNLYKEMNMDNRYNLFTFSLLLKKRYKDLAKNLRDEKIIYLFCFIPFMKMKRYRSKQVLELLGIPVLKMK